LLRINLKIIKNEKNIIFITSNAYNKHNYTRFFPCYKWGSSSYRKLCNPSSFIRWDNI